jgi:phage-related protein
MPETEVVFFKDDDGTAPLLVWLDTLPAKVQDKCIVRIERLQEKGHELRRPEADLLRDGIYELRASRQGIHYRMLYFFVGKVAVLSHGLVKEEEVPAVEIDAAVSRRQQFQAAPEAHTHEE